jgi:hypothetical protein
MELEVAVLLILTAPRQEVVEVSILRLSVRPGLHTHTMPDPIILSDNESTGAESETDHSNLEVDSTAKSADSDMADSEGFGSGTTYIPDRIVAGYRDNSNNDDVANSARLQLVSDKPTTHQASPMWVNSEITQGSASYNNLDVTKEAEDEGIDVFADNEDDAHTCSTRRSGSSAVSSNNPASNSNISISELQGSQLDSAQSL